MEPRVELFARIRRDSRVESLGIRALAKRHGVGRNTVRQALASAKPPPKKPRVRSAPRLGPFKAEIDQMLRVDLEAPRKQRHTAVRVAEILVERHGADVAPSYSTVRNYVRARRAEIAAERGSVAADAVVPQEHAPGEEAEVDFGEVWIVLAGVRTKCHMFIMRLSHSGRAVHRVYSTQSQKAFLEGHLEAFDEFGGVPTRHIRYDNLSSAVRRVGFGAGPG